MNSIPLTGLIGSNPLGALAAFGMVRVLAEGGGRPRLHFAERDDWVATVDCEESSVDSLIETLTNWLRSPRERMISWSDDVRVPEGEYRALLRAALSKDVELSLFLSALAADGARDKSKGLIKPTAFYMASGQQSFLSTMKDLLAHIREAPEKALREALVGPWAYSAPIWGAGWDPATERMHALRYKAPTKDKTTCVAGAVWLAFEALPLFPCFSTYERDRTVGFLNRDRLRHFRWPIVNSPTGIDELTMLLASREVATADANTKLRRGISAIYESTRHEFGQGYAVFRPARRIA